MVGKFKFGQNHFQKVVFLTKSAFTDRTCRCRQGFEPTGALCVDVNECARDPKICGPAATCTNTQGGYDCRCQAPLTGNPPSEPCKGELILHTYSPWQANLQFLLCDTQILCENKFDNFGTEKIVILVIVEVINFGVCRKFHC